MRLLPTAALAALLASVSTVQAKTITVTLVNGHPPVFRWVKHLQESFVPAVNKALAGTDIKFEWKQQYGGSLAKVGEELEAVQEGIADVPYESGLPPAFEVRDALTGEQFTWYVGRNFVRLNPGGAHVMEVL